MERSDRNSTRQGGADPKGPKGDIIDERLIRDRQEGQENIVDAAREEFARDQKDPDHPRAGRAPDGRRRGPLALEGLGCLTRTGALLHNCPTAPPSGAVFIFIPDRRTPVTWV